MTDYTKLVEALRHCMTKEDGITICEPCPYYGKGIECENVLHTDAAAAIEDMAKHITEMHERVTVLQIARGELEAEVERLKECNNELREAQTYIDHYGDKWMTSAKDVPTSAYNHGYMDGNNEAKQALEPKRGKMYFLEYDNPETGEYEQTYFQCSVCGKYFYGIDECEAKHFNYCPNCGAKMEVQDADT